MTSPSTRFAGVQPASGGGPRLHVEVVKLERIPPDTAIVGTFEVEADEHGNVLSFSHFRHTRRER
jgi:hypothetical protein